MPALAQATKRTATDLVPLGKTGIKISRLGIGTGVNNGGDQVALGKESFIKLIHYAVDKGVTYLDCAQRYQTFGWMGDAIKGLPREKLFIQSKVWPAANERDVLATVDMHRKNFNTDYIDSLLIHCRTEPGWTDQWKWLMDGFDEAKSRKWIHARGVSCHSFPALEAANTNPWADVHLVRINPQGKFMDGPNQGWSADITNPVQPVLDQIKAMHDKGRGIIGMKIYGNGNFTDAADREKSLRFALSNPNIDAFTIGHKTTAELDETIERINRILAEG
jgi:predicted aldo/keto reductase-like oxidoreductase